jgi:hypothetical protein
MMLVPGSNCPLLFVFFRRAIVSLKLEMDLLTPATSEDSFRRLHGLA